MKNLNMTINLVSSCQDNTLDQQETTWEQLCSLLSGQYLRHGDMSLDEYQTASDKKRKVEKDGAAWIPCSVRDISAGRSTSNMEQVYFLVLDIDSGMSVAEVKSGISGYEAVIHSSFSHTKEKPKWRVVLPLKEALPAHEISKVFDHFQVLFNGQLDGACGHDPSRLYYLPACPVDAEHLFVFEHQQGAWLDGVALLKGTALAAPKHLVMPGSVGVPGNPSSGVSEGGRNNNIFKHACRDFDEGHSVEDVTAASLKRNEGNTPPLDEAEVKITVASAQKNVQKKMLETVNNVNEIVERFNRDYAWVEKQGRVFRFRYRDFVPFDQLRQQYANTSLRVNVGGSEKWLNHAENWQRSDKRRTHSNVNFIPGGDEIVGNCINLWDGWGVTPKTGDISPWTELLDHLFSRDLAMRQWFEQWLAFPLQHPGAKLTTAVVLWSTKQGVGKSMIGETIGMIYGNHFRTVASTELHSTFNGWMKDCQFVLGEENSSSDQRADANRLKFLITAATTFVNEKHQPAIELTNCMNFLFTSNHADAFYLEDADRRFFIWEIGADRKSDQFYANFIDWRDNLGGLAALMDHLMNLDLTGFLPKGNAPETEAKQEMIRQSKTDVERWLTDVLEDPASVKDAFGKEIAHLNDITETYCRERRCRATSTAVSRALRRVCNHAKRRVMTRKRRQNLISLTNHEKWGLADSTEWAAEYERPTPVSL